MKPNIILVLFQALFKHRNGLAMNTMYFSEEPVGTIPYNIVTALQQDSRVLSVVSDFYQEGKLVAAICAAPVVLETAGILSGKEATVHHKFTEELVSAKYVSQEVVSDGNIITAWGLGAAIPFGLSIVERCCGLQEAERIRKAIGYIH